MSKAEKPLYGIFTKSHHIEKLTAFLDVTDLDFFISVDRNYLSRKCDIAVSYCFPRIIDFSKTGNERWFNFHPAPLPEYKGKYCYENAIRDKVTEYGTTLHVMAQEVDAGKILAANSFTLKSTPLSVSELGDITHYYLFQLFKENVRGLEHICLNKQDLEALKIEKALD